RESAEGVVPLSEAVTVRGPRLIRLRSSAAELPRLHETCSDEDVHVLGEPFPGDGGALPLDCGTGPGSRGDELGGGVGDGVELGTDRGGVVHGMPPVCCMSKWAWTRASRDAASRLGRC